VRARPCRARAMPRSGGPTARTGWPSREDALLGWRETRQSLFRTPPFHRPAPVARDSAEARVGIDGDGMSDRLEHRQVGQAVAVGVTGGKIGAELLGEPAKERRA